MLPFLYGSAHLSNCALSRLLVFLLLHCFVIHYELLSFPQWRVCRALCVAMHLFLIVYLIVSFYPSACTHQIIMLCSNLLLRYFCSTKTPCQLVLTHAPLPYLSLSLRFLRFHSVYAIVLHCVPRKFLPFCMFSIPVARTRWHVSRAAYDPMGQNISVSTFVLRSITIIFPFVAYEWSFTVPLTAIS